MCLLLLLSRFSRIRLCNPIDGSPPGFPVPGILQARTLEWAAISFSSAWKWKVKVKSLSHVWLLTTPWTAAHQAPPSMGFSRQEHRSGLPLPNHNWLGWPSHPEKQSGKNCGPQGPSLYFCTKEPFHPVNMKLRETAQGIEDRWWRYQSGQAGRCFCNTQPQNLSGSRTLSLPAHQWAPSSSQDQDPGWWDSPDLQHCQPHKGERKNQSRAEPGGISSNSR